MESSFRASCLTADCNACKVTSSQSSCRMVFLMATLLYCLGLEVHQLHRNCSVCIWLFLLSLQFISHDYFISFCIVWIVYHLSLAPSSPPKCYRTENPTGFWLGYPRVLVVFWGVPRFPKNQTNLSASTPETAIHFNWHLCCFLKRKRNITQQQLMVWKVDKF